MARSIIVTVHLGSDEYAAVEKVAAEGDYSMSQAVRRLVKQALSRAPEAGGESQSSEGATVATLTFLPDELMYIRQLSRARSVRPSIILNEIVERGIAAIKGKAAGDDDAPTVAPGKKKRLDVSHVPGIDRIFDNGTAADHIAEMAGNDDG